MTPIIADLDGGIRWLWPQSISFWSQRSQTQAIVKVEGCHVRLVGDWGTVTGVDIGTFATPGMAAEAKGRIEKYVVCPDGEYQRVKTVEIEQ
jgi:hypothetical protein